MEKKLIINYIIDLAMLIFFLITSISGLALLLLPKQVQRGGYQEIIGITKYQLVSIHNISGAIFILIVLLHLILHYRWFINITKSMFKKEK
ncbi:MAG: DUF4405 domain-containing protein [Candidatus Woesearchaeota archaeon]